MKPEKIKIALQSGDTTSALVSQPAGPSADTVIILAHGAGGDMTEPGMAAVHEACAEEGWSAVRFRFPYREAGRKAPDRAPALEGAYRSVVHWARSAEGLGARRVVLGGKSMGGRIASLLGATGEAMDGLLFLGYPLHPAGKPDKLRDAHLPVIGRPMLFVQGDRDPLCKLELLQPVLQRLGDRATLHVVADGDHSFKVRKKSGRTTEEARAEVVGASISWLRSIL